MNSAQIAKYPKVAKQVIRMIANNPAISTRKISEALAIKGQNISHVSVHNFLNKIGCEDYDRRLNFLRSYSGPGRLKPEIRKEIVDKALTGQNITNLSKEYMVSRDTIYRWLDKSKAGINLSDNYVEGKNHPKAVYPKHENQVLQIVANNPKASIHNISTQVPMSSWAVWNLLNKKGLSKAGARVQYANSQLPIVDKVDIPNYQLNDELKTSLDYSVPNTLAAPPPKNGILSLLGIFTSVSFLTIALSLLGLKYFDVNGYSIGTLFSSIALFMGGIFFLYSLKYYLTLILVLSYSQNENKSNKSNFSSWLLKNQKNDNIYNFSRDQATGLMANLDTLSIINRPFVSVHISIFNEKNVIERILKSVTAFDYPQYEIILADDSTDGTSLMIKTFQEAHLFKGEKMITEQFEDYSLTSVEIRNGLVLKHIHRNSRNGFKGAALSIALKQTDPRAEYVSIFDADFVPYPDTLELFLKYFKASEVSGINKNVAAVQGYQWHVLNKSENWITRGVRSEYSGSYVIERSGAEIYGGLKQISGSVYMINRSILEKIGWGTSITEDFELTLKLYERGYKVLYTPYIQAPAECVSTLSRLIRQRMRWAEGHSFNVKKMFLRLLTSDNLSTPEKLEFLYLSPYYLQAFFFMVGTLAWLISETIFKTQLPFWTEVWGWSLIITNFMSLPLLNSVGVFLEEGEKKDYQGIFSFMALSYILVPFQAYAAIKGFFEKEEGPWFRTPKTGIITDIFARASLMRFITGLIPKPEISDTATQYLALSTANNKFDNFKIKSKTNFWVGNLIVVLTISLSLLLSVSGEKVQTGNISDYPIQTSLTKINSENKFTADYLKSIFISEVKAKSDNLQVAVSKSVRNVSDDVIISSAGLLLSIFAFTLIILFKKRRKHFKRALKAFTVFTLLVSWLLTGNPILWNGKNFRFPPRLNEVKAAFPAFESCGTQFASVDAVVAPLPTGLSTNDILLMFIETSAQAITVSDSAGGTWTEVTNSPQSVTGTRLTVFWSRYNGTQTDPTVSDSTNHQIGIICAYSGVETSGNPWDVTSGSTDSSDDNSGALTGATTGGTDRLVVIVGTADTDVEVPITSISNTDLANISSARATAESTVGNDGGLTIFDGEKAAAGSYGTTTLTYPGNTLKAMMSIALKPLPGATAAVTGTATAGIGEPDIVSGGKTIILTLTDDTWVASGATFDAQRQNIIDGLDSAQSETNGWNNEVRDNQGVSGVVRTSSTVVTITLDAQAGYNTTAQETITVTIPGSALTGGSPITASPTFTVDTNVLAFVNQGVSANPDINSVTDATSYSTSSDWTPPNGLVIAYVYSRYTTLPVIPTVSGNSITWKLIRTTTILDHRLSIFAANGNGATSGATTISFGSQTQIGATVSFFNATGAYLADGPEGAFVQTQVGSGTGTSGSISLNAATDSNNRPIAGFAHAANESVDPRTNWTEIDDLATTGPVRSLETQYRSDAFETTASTQAWNTSSAWLGIAAEIRMIASTTVALEQTAFRIRTDDTQALSENTTGWAAALNTNASLIPDEEFRIRFEIDHDGGGSLSQDFELWYSRSGAEYQPVPNNATPFSSGSADGQKTVQAIPSAQYDDLDATTNLLSQSANTFVAGTGNADFAAPSVSLTDPSHTELEWTILIRKLFDQKGHNADGSTFAFQVRRNGGGLFETYSQTPTVTVLNDPGHIGGSVPENPMRYFVIDGNKNLYYLAECSDIQDGDIFGNSPCMMKSTDGGDSWNLVGVATSSDEGDIEAVDMDLRGDTIHIVMEGPGNGDAASYWQFNVSTHGSTPDTWALNNDIIEDSLSPLTQAAAIAQRSDGTTVVAYGGPLSSSRGQIWYSIKDGTWSTPARLDTEAGKNFTGVGAVRDASDVTHIVYSGDNNSTTGYVYLNTISATDVLGTRRELFSATGFGGAEERVNITPPFVWNDGTQERVGVAYKKFSDDKLYFRSWPSNDTSSLSSEVVISDSAVLWNQGGSEQLIADVRADDATDKLHSVFADQSTGDIFYDTRDFSGNWTTDTELNDAVDADWIRSQLFTHSSGNGGNKVLGYVWDNNSGGGTGYTEYSEKIITAYNLASYRFFNNADSTDVGSTLAAQDTVASIPSDGGVIRMRILLRVDGNQLGSSGDNFKVQIAQKSGTCDISFSGESYTDLDPSSGDIRYYNNPTPTDGSALTGNANDPNYTGTEVNQTYEESNNFTNSVSAISAGENGKWDITIVDNSAADSTSYCLRVVRSDGQLLDTYTVVPEFATVPENPLLLISFIPFVGGILKKLKRKIV